MARSLFRLRLNRLHLNRLTRCASTMLFAACCFGPQAARPNGLATAAEYIIGFVRYVHWEGEDAFTAWNVCIVGDRAAASDKPYENELVRGKPFAVRHIGADANLVGCQVLDLTAANATTSSAVLLRARRLPIFSVGSGSAFCSEGGLACLSLQNSEQKFEVNLSAIRDSGLNVSARLLMLGSGRTAGKDGP